MIKSKTEHTIHYLLLHDPEISKEWRYNQPEYILYEVDFLTNTNDETINRRSKC